MCLRWANRQSLAFSERGQLSQTIPQFHVERMLHEWTPIARFESQHNAGSMRTSFCVLEEDMTANDATDLNRGDNSR